MAFHAGGQDLPNLSVVAGTFKPVAAVATVLPILRADCRAGAIGNATGFPVVHGWDAIKRCSAPLHPIPALDPLAVEFAFEVWRDPEFCSIPETIHLSGEVFGELR